MSSPFSSLSSREQRLMMVTGILVSAVAILGIGYKGFEHIQILDRQIANSEQELLNLYEQTMQQRSVDAAFGQVVSQHSTGQSKEEIHDSLRREIYRLALEDPDSPEKEVYLVAIPTLNEGVLREEGAGYKEYQVRFRVPQCTLTSGLTFLKRLEQSNLLLRIDTFEMSRAHESSQISLTIEVTRTVLSEVHLESDIGNGTGDEARRFVDDSYGSGRRRL